MLSRREFLNFSAATIAFTSLPNQIQSSQLIRNYKLTAEITPHLFDKKGVLDSLWLYNKQSPGPVIEAKENDIIEYDGSNWTVVFNSNNVSTPQYVTNSFTSKQFKWTGKLWISSYEGEYNPGFWRLVL